MSKRQAAARVDTPDRTSRARTESNRPLAASALTGDLSFLLAAPTALLDATCSVKAIEQAAVKEASSLQSLSTGHLELSLEDSGRSKTETDSEPSPVSEPSLPCFGLGLVRQRAFAPAHFFTESEAAAQGDMRTRCANALRRLARRTTTSLQSNLQTPREDE